jgi:C-terminal processing protease CtpA/Prc
VNGWEAAVAEERRTQWDEVGESFAQLGRRMRERYEGQPAGGSEDDSRAVEDALRTMREALDRAVTALGDTVRDPGFREDAKRATRTLGEALSASLAVVGDELRDRFGRRGQGPPASRPGA